MHCSLFCPTSMSHFLLGTCWDARSQVEFPISLSVKWGHFIDLTEVATGQTNPSRVWDANWRACTLRKLRK